MATYVGEQSSTTEHDVTSLEANRLPYWDPDEVPAETDDDFREFTYRKSTPYNMACNVSLIDDRQG